MSESTPPQGPYRSPQPLSPEDEKLWATLIHLGGIFFNFLPALIGYVALKDRGPFVRQQTAAALNFQITLAIAGVIGAFTIILVIGILILVAAGIVNLIFSILAAVAANRGEHYEYPIAIRFLR